MKSFDELLLVEILNNLENQYIDNYDFYRFGIQKNTFSSWKSKIKFFLTKILRLRNINLDPKEYEKKVRLLSPYFSGLRNLFQLLADENSKLLLIKLLAYRILGYQKVKLPLNTKDYWVRIKAIDKFKKSEDFIHVPFENNNPITFYKFDLRHFEVPIDLYNNAGSIYHLIYVRQYEYNGDKVTIKPEKGDVIFDCGACWGDNSLFFANEVGEEGHVYSFDFFPDNIKIFNINVNLNPLLNDRITLITNPLWDVSGQEFSFTVNGPGSQLTSVLMPGSLIVNTISLDDFLAENGLKKVDFIKMDVEGSELRALKGGVNIIRKFKPKLAISIYHSLDDFVQIPEYISSLNLGYKFYLKHGTIHSEETVLIAMV